MTVCGGCWAIFKADSQLRKREKTRCAVPVDEDNSGRKSQKEQRTGLCHPCELIPDTHGPAPFPRLAAVAKGMLAEMSSIVQSQDEVEVSVCVPAASDSNTLTQCPNCRKPKKTNLPPSTRIHKQTRPKRCHRLPSFISNNVSFLWQFCMKPARF